MNFEAWILLLKGAWTTLWISGLAIIIGVSAGLLIALIRQKKIPVIEQILVFYISIVRSTPLITLVLFLFLSLPALGIHLEKHIAAILSLAINTAAFNAEIWRSAIHNFAKDQREAALSVGMTPWIFFRHIMLPQIVTVSLPPLVNEMSFLIKGSPAIAIIGLVDLTRVTNRIAAVTYQPLYPILGAGLIYMVIVGVLVRLQYIAERQAHRLAV
ncbi:amino acid ABC transporter permease [Celerinatantimonas diazotrophica]|uniref:Amino acid ABC transporter membrane protein 1 (PAAT family) n=1 Tax=Celerinatantimonas diazotrophica TaxID=412034 RepID=A0A4R1K3A8_9GAMM|nr:amino acid ABC transporter permease [Celerinatantimonas diazotrophica]TCK58564.1 amino acid ABC transporter membrane protein 1 (PAAT family) [Celerinatantimonas diazotrophica]CAG9297193.1 L-cystine transport system permease protein YecS [Celerinatantimonas diazotrophica]